MGSCYLTWSHKSPEKRCHVCLGRGEIEDSSDLGRKKKKPPRLPVIDQNWEMVAQRAPGRVEGVSRRGVENVVTREM